MEATSTWLGFFFCIHPFFYGLSILGIPRILSIEATRQSNTVKITCKADAKPAPDYKIYRNGIRLSGDDGEATHDITGSVEQYKCVARNIFGNVSETRNYTGEIVKL